MIDDDRDARGSGVDTLRPHPARRYDYWLGGKDNYAVDRASGDAIAEAFPTIRTAVVHNRLFMHRAVRFLAHEAGVRQFLDIGTGIPTTPNVHDLAQGAAPESRVVYVDYAAEVVTRARAMLRGTRAGATAYVHADVREPDTILTEARETLDFTRPVALLLVAVMHFVPDAKAPVYVRTLLQALPPGSYLVFSHATADHMTPAEAAATLRAAGGRKAFRFRSEKEVTRFFAGTGLLEPGLVSVAHWRPDGDRKPPSAAEVGVWGGVALKGPAS